MKRLVQLTFLVCAVSTAAAHVVPLSVPRDCRRGSCRAAINRCVNESCASFRGIVKSACKSAARRTIRTSCAVAGDHAAFCSELARNPCNGG